MDTGIKRKEPKIENVYRGISLPEFLSRLEEKGLDLKSAKVSMYRSQTKKNSPKD